MLATPKLGQAKEEKKILATPRTLICTSFLQFSFCDIKYIAQLGFQQMYSRNLPNLHDDESFRGSSSHVEYICLENSNLRNRENILTQIHVAVCAQEYLNREQLRQGYV